MVMQNKSTWNSQDRKSQVSVLTPPRLHRCRHSSRLRELPEPGRGLTLTANNGLLHPRQSPRILCIMHEFIVALLTITYPIKKSCVGLLQDRSHPCPGRAGGGGGGLFPQLPPPPQVHPCPPFQPLPHQAQQLRPPQAFLRAVRQQEVHVHSHYPARQGPPTQTPACPSPQRRGSRGTGQPRNPWRL